jgi:co-chaperonin GroES (HSP10)
MANHFRPLRDRVLLKRVEVEDRTSAGIIIPDTAREKPAEGEVLAVGPGAPDERAATCCRQRSRSATTYYSASGRALMALFIVDITSS